MQALDLTRFALAAGRFETVLVASAGIATFTTDHRKLGETGIFGDGAAAAVLRRTPPALSSRIFVAVPRFFGSVAE